ncbi:hypothetical protein [uncultured Methanospirillum sp.]|uniref:hypothetical protein n=1 Tax=uncultured Methanospirillum sp. TaxID=262503 RepID=UPI0029C632F8|nr:hypothetical protein [uncultured Methanospirillum sp.]
MISTGPCDSAVQEILAGLPSDPDLLIQYLLAAFRRYENHPCILHVAREISSVLLTRISPEDFTRFCMDSGNPEPLLTPLLSDLTGLVADRSFDQAALFLPYLLPFGERSWPDFSTEEYRSFRDLIEYTYYMTECSPERDLIMLPFLGTDILYMYGKYLSGIRDDEAAVRVLQKARHQSPVHAGILGELVSLLLKSRWTTEAGPLLTRSFRTAWLKEDLALAFRNQGFLFSLQEDDVAAITCYLMAETWEESTDGREELRLLSGRVGDIDHEYYNREGLKILTYRGVSTGPDPVIISLLTGIAENYLDENNLLKAREYLIRAGQLLMSDEIEDRIMMIERRLEDGGVF